MAAVDDIYVGGAPTMTIVAERIAEVLSRPVATAPDGRPYVDVDERTHVAVYDDADKPGTYIVEVYHAGAVAPRRKLSDRIYRALVRCTRWDLTLVSDDEPGTGVVAERSAARA